MPEKFESIELKKSGWSFLYLLALPGLIVGQWLFRGDEKKQPPARHKYVHSDGVKDGAVKPGNFINEEVLQDVLAENPEPVVVQKKWVKPKSFIGDAAISVEEVESNLAIYNDRGSTQTKIKEAEENLKNITAEMGKKGHVAYLLTIKGVTSFEYKLKNADEFLTIFPPSREVGKGAF